jgi:hypothetical protein
VTAVAAGESHSLALLGDGRVFAWGENEFGQLGDGSEETRLAPVEVDLSGFGSPPVDVFAANWSSYALLESGAFIGWGRNSGGQLGDGSEAQQLTPVAADLAGFGSGVESAAVGDDNVLALLRDGELVGWGANFTGQIGDGTEIDRPAPVAVDASAFGSPVTEVSLGRDHSLALLEDGRVLAWGGNLDSQLGSEEAGDRLAPGLVAGIDEVEEIVATYATSTVRRTDGTVWGWGHANLGQLGVGEGQPTETATPLRTDLTRADALAEGWSAKHMLAMTVAGPPPEPEQPPEDGDDDSGGATDPTGPAIAATVLPPAPAPTTVTRRARHRDAVHVRCRAARRGRLVCRVAGRGAEQSRARLLRRGRVYAAGTLRRMRAVRRIRAGRYLLVVGKGPRARRFAARVTVSPRRSTSHPVNQRRRSR